MVSILLFCQYMEPNVFVFSTKKKEVDSSAPLKKSDFKPFVPARSVERKMEKLDFCESQSL